MAESELTQEILNLLAAIIYACFMRKTLVSRCRRWFRLSRMDSPEMSNSFTSPTILKSPGQK